MEKNTVITVKTKQNKVRFELTAKDVGDACNSTGKILTNVSKPGEMLDYDLVKEAYSRQQPGIFFSPSADPCSDEAGVLTVNRVQTDYDKNEIAARKKPVTSVPIYNQSK